MADRLPLVITDGVVQQLQAGDSIDGSAIDHGTLAGLGDDDHSQYVLVTDLALTTQNHTCGSHLVGVPIVAGATVDNLHDMVNDFASAGRRTGGEITDAGGETVNIAAGTGYLKANDIDTDELIAFDWVASNGVAIPTDTTRYIGVEWNGGAPQIVVKLANTWDLDTEFYLGKVVNCSTELAILNDYWWVTDGMTNIIERFGADGHLYRDSHVGGLIIGYSGVNYVTCTQGKVWARLNELDVSSFDSTGAGDSFNTFYQDSAGDWYHNSGVSQYLTTHWNNTGLAHPNELVALGANKYANWWVYWCGAGNFVLVYPQAYFNTAASAENEQPPSGLPDALEEMGLLLGRITFKTNSTAPVEVVSAFDITFTPALAADHGNLSGLDDDDHSAIYPLTDGTRAFTGAITAPGYVGTTNVVLTPTAAGYIMAGTGGDARGNYAIDLQIDRSNVAMVASGANSVLLGGQDNTNAASLSVIGGGHDNDIAASSTFSFIGGGEDNGIPTVCGTHNVIVGGDTNLMVAAVTNNGENVIGGGFDNNIQGRYSVVVGGHANTMVLAAGVLYSTIVGGWLNNLASDYNFMGGGYRNDIGINCNDSGIGGGRDNSIVASPNSYIFGGYQNDIVTSTDSTIGGGDTNIINTSAHSFIGGGDTNSLTGSVNAVIAGGDTNSIIASGYSVIVGGNGNAIPTGCGDENFLGGGADNILNTATTNNGRNVLVGGDTNYIEGELCFVGGGLSNNIVLAAGVKHGVIVGGQTNDIAADYAAILGGFDNDIAAACDYATIVGGDSNDISGTSTHSFIGGGDTNVIQTASSYATISGGDTNSITASTHSFIGGGDTNVIPTACGNGNVIVGGTSNLLVSGAGSNGVNFIGGGTSHSVQGYGCTIAGGRNGTISRAGSNYYATIGGGRDNSVTTNAGGTIAGGSTNTVSSAYGFIGGGLTNTCTSGAHNVVVGGTLNDCAAVCAFIGGGEDNNITSVDAHAVIVGGDSNDISGTSTHAFIGGGDTNSIYNSTHSVICGGDTNSIPNTCGTHNFIGGGNTNSLVAAATYNGANFIGSGYSNSIQGTYCVITGGYDNTISSAAGIYHGTVGGGRDNTVSGNRATISGGYTNAASGAHATVPGGSTNTASGELSLASGYEAVATRYGQHAQAAGKDLVAGDAQTSVFVMRAKTTDDTATELFLDGSAARLTIPTYTSWFFKVTFVARQTNDDFTVNGGQWTGLATRDAGNISILNSNLDINYVNDFGWAFAVSADTGNQSLKLEGTGLAANDISWVARVEIVEVAGDTTP